MLIISYFCFILLSWGPGYFASLLTYNVVKRFRYYTGSGIKASTKPSERYKRKVHKEKYGLMGSDKEMKFGRENLHEAKAT